MRFLEFGAIKLTTDFPMEIGGLEIPVGNITDGYPGVYGVWLKRTEDGWSLVVTNEPDVWGTQFDASSVHGEVPLERSAADEPADQLTAKLDESSEGSGSGNLVLSWGEHQWTTTFKVDAGA